MDTKALLVFGLEERVDKRGGRLPGLGSESGSLRLVISRVGGRTRPADRVSTCGG